MTTTFKQIALLFALGLAGVASAADVPSSARGAITTQNLVPAGAATANSCVELRFAGMGSATAQVTGTYTGALSLQRTANGTTWETLSASSTFTNAAGTSTATIASGTTGTFILGNVAGFRSIRVCGLAAMTGTATVALQSSVSGGSSGGVAGGGDATAANQTTQITELQDIEAAITATNTQLPPATGTQSIANSMSVTPATAATFPISAASLPLPTGAATSANQVPGSATATADATRLPVDIRDGNVLATATCTSNATMTGSNIDVSAYGTLSLQVTSVGGGVTIAFEGSNDNTNFLGWKGEQTNTTNASGASTANGTNSYILGRRYKYLRLVCSSYTSGTPTVVIVGFAGMASTHVTVSGGASTMQVGGAAAHSSARNGNPAPVSGRALSTVDTSLATGDTSDFIMDLNGATTVKPFSVAGSDWNYTAAASGIVNTTTAVTIKAAGSGSLRNYITYCHISHGTLGGATEFVVRDGAGGTVLYRTLLHTTALPTTYINFPTPRRGTAATLLEVATLTAVTGAVYANCGGYEAP